MFMYLITKDKKIFFKDTKDKNESLRNLNIIYQSSSDMFFISPIYKMISTF